MSLISQVYNRDPFRTKVEYPTCFQTRLNPEPLTGNWWDETELDVHLVNAIGSVGQRLGRFGVGEQSPVEGGGNPSIVLSVLTSIERDSAITQRKLAHDLGIALGLANAYLRRCVRKGLVKMRQVPINRY